MVCPGLPGQQCVPALLVSHRQALSKVLGLLLSWESLDCYGSEVTKH